MDVWPGEHGVVRQLAVDDLSFEVAEGVAAEQLAELFGQSVVVSGTAVFRASGALLRIEGTYVWTADPRQGTAWLVEGNPLHP